MIVTRDKDAKTTSFADPPLPETTTDLPPAYEGPVAPAIPANLKPGNFFFVSRPYHSVKGQFAVDPTIDIPQALLPEIDSDEPRRNLYLHSSSSSVDGEVYVSRGDGGLDPKSATICAKSQYSSVTLKVHDLQHQPTKIPLRIEAISPYSSVTLHIPRSFRGPITVSSSYSSIRLSEGIKAAMTSLGEVGGTRKGFIGDLTRWNGNHDTWNGDTAIAKSEYSSVSVYFDDEQRDGPAQFFGRIFGFRS